MKVKYKQTHPNAVTPTKGSEHSAGLDLTAVSKTKIYSSTYNDVLYIEYSFGLAFEIPEGHLGFILPRSSISKKKLSLSNSLGLIDSDFRGTLTARFRVQDNDQKYEYDIGDKIAQLVILPYPEIELEKTEELSETQRGEGGYGSTDGKEKSQAW